MDVTTRLILVPLLAQHEGKRRFPYLDTATPPRITIGIGRNLSDRGLSPDEINYLFENDLRLAEMDARSVVGDAVFAALSPNRQAVMLDMAFNMGMTRLLRFVEMLACIKAGQWAKAKVAMLDSLWAKQVGERAVLLADMMEKG